ncbi:MAG: PQQ-binding-like beta-propeller repeat protein [Pirellulaceae bacterium]
MRLGLTRIFLCMLALDVSIRDALADDAALQFRGTDGTGIVKSATLPTNWDRDTNIAWRTELPGEGWSSPVVSDGRIYLTAAIATQAEETASSDQAYDLALLILDADNGELLARKDLIHQTAAELKKIHSKNSHASPSPLVAGNRVFVHFGHQGTACTDLLGNTVWVNRDLSFNPVHGNGGSPILVGDHLIFTCDGANSPYVAALQADTGKLAWKCQRPVDATKKFSFCTPSEIVVDGKTQVVAPGSDCVLGIDPVDGSIIWQVDYDGYSVVPKPVYADGRLFVCTGYDRGGILAIDPTGKGNITQSHVLWRIDNGAPKTPSVLAKNDLLFMINDGGVALCLDAATGETIWKERIGGKYSASPVMSGDKIYFTSEEGKTTIVQAGREFKQIATNDLQERTLASMAAVGDAIFLRTAKALYRIESQ